MFQIVNHIGLLRRHEVAQCDNPWPCDNWISHPCLLAKGRFSALKIIPGNTVVLLSFFLGRYCMSKEKWQKGGVK